MKTVLIAEDEEDVRLNLKDLLESESYNVLVACNGKEAYEQAVENIPDLILSDIKMPILDGYQLYDLINSNPLTATIPFIFLTAKIDHSDVRKGMAIGADDYIEKPFKIEDVLTAIETRLRKKEQHQIEIKKIKDSLLRKIPHELRTPLVSILGFTEMIEDDIDDLTKDELKGMTAKIRKSGKRLHRRVEKFLTYAEIVANESSLKDQYLKMPDKYMIESEELTIILRDTISDFDRLLDVEIKFEPDELNIQDYYYKIILKELLENALKYSDQGSQVKIIGKADRQYYKTQFVDHGIGIPKNAINRINALTQFSEEGEFREGVGLGLALVQKILNMVGGYLSARSTKEKKTIIEFGVPLSNYRNKDDEPVHRKILKPNKTYADAETW